MNQINGNFILSIVARRFNDTVTNGVQCRKKSNHVDSGIVDVIGDVNYINYPGRSLGVYVLV